MTCRLLRIAFAALVAVVLTFVCISASAAGYLLGDADSDGEVSILDATCIQRVLVGLPVSGVYCESAADADMNSDVEIIDATYIQRWLAEIDTPYPIGTEFGSVEEPTEAGDKPSQMPTDEEGWGREIFRP